MTKILSVLAFQIKTQKFENSNTPEIYFEFQFSRTTCVTAFLRSDSKELEPSSSSSKAPTSQVKPTHPNVQALAHQARDVVKAVKTLIEVEREYFRGKCSKTYLGNFYGVCGFYFHFLITAYTGQTAAWLIELIVTFCYCSRASGLL